MEIPFILCCIAVQLFLAHANSGVGYDASIAYNNSACGNSVVYGYYTQDLGSCYPYSCTPSSGFDTLCQVNLPSMTNSSFVYIVNYFCGSGSSDCPCDSSSPILGIEMAISSGECVYNSYFGQYMYASCSSSGGAIYKCSDSACTSCNTKTSNALSCTQGGSGAYSTVALCAGYSVTSGASSLTGSTSSTTGEMTSVGVLTSLSQFALFVIGVMML